MARIVMGVCAQCGDTCSIVNGPYPQKGIPRPRGRCQDCAHRDDMSGAIARTQARLGTVPGAVDLFTVDDIRDLVQSATLWLEELENQRARRRNENWDLDDELLDAMLKVDVLRPRGQDEGGLYWWSNDKGPCKQADATHVTVGWHVLNQMTRRHYELHQAKMREDDDATDDD